MSSVHNYAHTGLPGNKVGLWLFKVKQEVASVFRHQGSYRSGSNGNNDLSNLHLQYTHTSVSELVAFLTSFVPVAVKLVDKPLPLQLDRRFSLQSNNLKDI